MTQQRPVRPEFFCPDTKAKAIDAIIGEVADWLEEEPSADLREQLASCAAQDGYDFARELDDRYGWQPTAALVEILDEYGAAQHRALAELVRAWVAENGVTIPFSVGDLVTLRGQPARIVALRPEEATIVAQPLTADGTDYGATGGWIHPFEDAAEAPKP